jgi:stress-induced-phosphoprotein 1
MHLSAWERDAAYKKKERKVLGDATCKKKYFEIFIQHYTKEWIWVMDISFLINRSVIYLEMGKYEECIKDCDTYYG